MSRRKWTPDEDTFLRDHYATMSASEIGKALGRDRISVKNRVMTLRRQGTEIYKPDEYFEQRKGVYSDALREYWATDTVRKNEEKRLKMRETIVDKLVDLQLTYEQEQMMLGSLMGNMSILRPYRQRVDPFPKLQIMHGAQYRDYVEWKYAILENLVMSPPSFQQDSRNRFGVTGSWKFSTRALPCFTPYYDLLKPGDGERRITPEWLAMIDGDADPALALATWYMDSAVFQTRLNSDTGSFSGHSIHFSLGVKSNREMMLLKHWLFMTYDAEFHPYTQYYPDGRLKERRLSIHRRAEIEPFIERVAPYVMQVPSMRRKIDLQY